MYEHWSGQSGRPGLPGRAEHDQPGHQRGAARRGGPQVAQQPHGDSEGWGCLQPDAAGARPQGNLACGGRSSLLVRTPAYTHCVSKLSGQTMGRGGPAMAAEADRVEFRVAPGDYEHWQLAVEPPIGTVVMASDRRAATRARYELKLNSYDLGVDIELYDIVQRLRFEHPEVHAVVLTSGKDRVFSAGANIRMLAEASHAWKVNCCKFTNETRNAMED